MMNIKYLKNPKTREKFYPITKSDCIIDAFSINDLEIDKLFYDSLSVPKSQNGMSYLNLQGLNHYHSKIKEQFDTINKTQVYTAGENITIENNVISAVIPEVDLSGYATEEFVTSQGYLTEIPEGIASKQWVKDAISEVDLSDYQTKSDEQLATQNKTITGAINELVHTQNPYSELFVDVVESGFYIVDEEYRIGFCVNDLGAHSPNLIEYVK